MAAASALDEDLGRNEVRVYSAPYTIEAGRTAVELRLPQRLELRGYRRVHRKPTHPGEYRYDAVDGAGYLLLALMERATGRPTDMLASGW